MSPDEIIHEVARLTDIPASAIVGKKRTTAVTWAKMLATREIRRQFPHWSLEDIGRSLGEINHCTVIHRLRQAEWLYVTKPAFRRLSNYLYDPPLEFDI